MRVESLDEEVGAVRSYEQLLKSWERTAIDHVDIETLENEVLHCEIVEGAWVVAGEEFPTIEALLQSKSKKFEVLWNAELCRRLKGLQKAEAQ